MRIEHTPKPAQGGAPALGALTVESRPAHIVTRECPTCKGYGYEWVMGSGPLDMLTDECETCHGDCEIAYEVHPVIDGEVS
jgi:hypothetical protein